MNQQTEQTIDTTTEQTTAHTEHNCTPFRYNKQIINPLSVCYCAKHCFMALLS